MAELEDFAEFHKKQTDVVGQNLQDAWVLYETSEKRNGYFVDFGATDGKTINNTFLLEKKYGWQGIVAEPNVIWHNDLAANRSCHVSFDCVWTKTGEKLEFLLTDAPDLSTIKGFGLDDEHASKRQTNKTLTVNTISLTDLLKKYDAPNVIDYLSLDTEGSEYDILLAFFRESFDDYRVEHITIEHNYVPEIRNKIYTMLTMNGYERKFTEISRCDDFYKRIK